MSNRLPLETSILAIIFGSLLGGALLCGIAFGIVCLLWWAGVPGWIGWGIFGITSLYVLCSCLSYSRTEIRKELRREKRRIRSHLSNGQE